MILPNICKRMNLYYYFFLPEKSFRLGSFRVIQGHSMSFRPWISGHFELIQSVRSVKWLQTKVIWRWNVASDASYLNEFNGQNHGVRSYWVIWGHSETSSQTSAFFGRWKLEWFSSFIGFIFWFEVIWVIWRSIGVKSHSWGWNRTYFILRDGVLRALNLVSVDILAIVFSSSSTTGKNSRATNVAVS